MTDLGITGHQLREGIDWDWVGREIETIIRTRSPVASFWSCLATGADTIAAEKALESGWSLKVVVPHADYASVFDDRDRARFEGLMRQAAEIMYLSPADDHQKAYMMAGRTVVDRCSLLIAVWDGKPAAGLGGTGDVIDYAREQNRDVVWLDVKRLEVVHG